MSNIWFSAIAASILTPMIVGWVANRTREVTAGRDGWRRVRPNGGLYAMIFACGGFSMLLFYVYFFVGSARADAESQMRILSILASAFLAATLWAIWSTFRESVEWQGHVIRVRSIFGGERNARLEQLETIGYSSLQSVFLLRFAGGQMIKLSPYMDGTRQLLQHIDRVAPGAAPERYYAPDDDDE